MIYLPCSPVSFLPVSSAGIVPVTPRAAPAPHPVPAPLPGGEGTRIPPLAPAHGVAPGRALAPLRDKLSGAEAFTGAVYDSSAWWSLYTRSCITYLTKGFILSSSVPLLCPAMVAVQR